MGTLNTNKNKLYLLMLVTLNLTIFAANVHATSWYVDNSASGSNSGTSWTNAWESFADVNWGSGGVTAGDTLYISGGSTSKTYNEVLRVGASGSNGNPITIRAGQDASHNGVVIIDRKRLGEAINVQSKSYITIDGAYNGNRHIELYRGGLSDGYNALIEATGANHTRYLYLDINDAATGIRQNGQRASNTTEIAYSYIHDIRGQCAIDLTMSSGQTPSTHGNFAIHHNTIAPIWEKYNGGSLIKGPDGVQATGSVEFFNNQVTGINGGIDTGVTVGGQHPDMIQAQNAYWKIYNNHFLNIGDSAIDFDTFSTHYVRHVWIYNNIFSVGGSTSIYPQGIRIYDSMGSMSEIYDLLIANNTFADVYNHYPLRLQSSIGGANLIDVLVKNNLFYNSGVSRISDAPALSGSTASDWNFDFNLVNKGTSGSNTVQLDGTVYTQPHGILNAPSFKKYSTKSDSNDYHLEGGSAGINQGADLSSYFTTDKDGNPRSGSWDIGAYEYSGSGVVVDNPQNLTVTGSKP